MRLKTLPALGGLGVLALVLLGLAAYRAPPFPGDLDVARFVQGWQSPVLDAALRGVSFLGSGPVGPALALLIAAALYLAGRPRDAVFALGTLVADALDFLMKNAVARPRPETAYAQGLDSLSVFSFPSGHATHAVALYGYLFFLVTVSRAGTAWRRAAQVGLALLMALTGLSRVYLGVHWPSDVLGGYLLGALALGAVLALRRRVFLRGLARPASPGPPSR